MITTAVKTVMKNFVKNLVHGKMADVLKMRTPANIHTHRTYLDALIGEMAFIEGMLYLLKKHELYDDPVARMQYLTCANLATISFAIEYNGLKSPLNPILGETFVQTTKAGSTLYAEQTSHHPPISHFYLTGPEDMPYKLYGYVEFKLGISSTWTSCQFTSPGKVTLELPGGVSKYDIQTKTVDVSGLLSSTKNFNIVNTCTITDLTNNIASVTHFDSQKNQRTGYWKSWVKGSDKVNKQTGVLDNRRDLITIEIIDLKQNKVISEGYGSYLENIAFGEGKNAKTILSINDVHLQPELTPPPAEMILPSNSNLRADSLLIK